jgi:uncharacterized protein (TIGR00299 family) protein
VDADALRGLLDDVCAGRVSAAAAARTLARLPFADLGYARIDHHRALRQGLPEAVYGPGKTPEACAGIVAELLANDTGPVILTRASEEQVAHTLATNPGGRLTGTTVVWRPRPPDRPERVTVVTAGTADEPVAGECHAVLVAHGFCPRRLSDIGVAGLHRVLPHVDELAAADIVVVVAGMEGALASVVGGSRRDHAGPGHRRTDERRLWGFARGRDRPPGHAGVLLAGGDRRRHRQRVRRRVRRGAGLPAASRPVTTVAWFQCGNGVAGDMVLGALLDAGADLDAVRAGVAGLGVMGWNLDVETTQRCGIGATRAVVTTEESHVHRPFAAIRDLLAAASLPPRVLQRALATFTALTEVEGAIHGREPMDVEFHEVGALDAIVDVVGSCAALELLGVDEVSCSPLALGHGTVKTAHGVLPNPAPAVLALAARAGAPVSGVDVSMELTTPTGAALMTALADRFGPPPAMTPAVVGYGAGARDMDGRPNLVQVVVGTAAPESMGTTPGQAATLLEVNVDDATGETLAVAVVTLLDAGAYDAWITPIVMKKGRPAHTVSALCDPALTAVVATTMTSATGSLGVRATALERWPHARTEGTVSVDGEPVRVKVGAGRVKAEHDDVVDAARRLRRPVHEVAARAEAAWRSGEQR